MRQVIFYRNENGKAPVETFFNTLSDKQIEKLLWVLRIIKGLERIPKQYFKKLTNSDDIWEVRIRYGNKNFRLLGFFYKSNLIILTNAFVKKSQKTPRKEIKLAVERKREYIKRNK